MSIITINPNLILHFLLIAGPLLIKLNSKESLDQSKIKIFQWIQVPLKKDAYILKMLLKEDH